MNNTDYKTQSLTEKRIFYKFPRRIKNLICRHMQYYVGVDNQTYNDYAMFPVSYIYNFCLDIKELNKFFPSSYSETKKIKTHKELMGLLP